MTADRDQKPLRVLLKTGSARLGGTELQVVRLARELDRRGHDVTLVLFDEQGPNLRLLDGTGVRVVGLGVPLESTGGRRQKVVRMVRYVLAAAQLLRIMRRLRPDVVHAFLLFSYVIAIPVARLVGVPVRVVAHRNTGYELTSRTRGLGMNIAIRAATHATANARAVAEVFPPVPGGEPVEVIGNGIDPPAESADPSQDPPRCVYVANLRPVKNHDLLLRALARMQTPLQVDLIGAGPEHDRLVDEVRRLGIEDQVCFVGAVSGASEVLPRYQMATLTSMSEGSPNAVLEAMAAGLPVVATAVGGVEELVVEGETGFIVAPGDVDALAAQLDRLATDPQLRARLGRTGRERVLALAGWSTIATRYEELYRSVPSRR